MKFNEAITKFNAWRAFSVQQNTVASYRIHLNYLCLYLRNPEIESIKYEDIISYLEGMRELNWDQNSFMVKCIAFRKFFEFMRKQKLNVLDPELIPIPEREYKFPRVATEDTYQKLLDTIPKNNDPRHIRNRVIIMMFWATGLRHSELLSLNLADMDLVNMKTFVKTKKSKKLHPVRQVFWDTETNEALKAWLNKREALKKTILNMDPEALLISVTGLKAGARLKKSGLSEMMRRYSQTAKLGFVCNPHSLRHHFGRKLAREGANNSVISSMMGHSNLESSYVYTILDGKSMEDEYTKFFRKDKILLPPVDKVDNLS